MSASYEPPSVVTWRVVGSIAVMRSWRNSTPGFSSPRYGIRTEAASAPPKRMSSFQKPNVKASFWSISVTRTASASESERRPASPNPPNPAPRTPTGFLAPIAPADRAGVVELDVPSGAQRGGEILGLGREVSVARQRQHRHLDGRQPRVQPHDGALLHHALGVRRLVLTQRVEQERQDTPGQAGCRLDHIRRPPLALVLVEEREIGATVLRVRRQVEVGAVGDALELGPLRSAEAEPVFDVDRALRVVRQLLVRMLVVAQVVGRDAEVDVPVPALLEPVVVPLLVTAGLDEVLHLHLLELARAEDEVAGGDLVAERLAGLCDAERRLLARRSHDVEEVDEDALRGLGPQVVQPTLVLDRTEIGLQQPVEHARLSPG